MLTRKKYRALLRACRAILQPCDLKTIRRAFALVLSPGEEEIYGDTALDFSLDIALILAQEIGVPQCEAVVSCILYHDVLIQRLPIARVESTFGIRVATITREMAMISSLQVHDSRQQAEHFRTLLLTIVTDVRVLLVKLAERLNLMRRLDRFDPEEASAFAWDTFYLFAPLAHRLGLYSVKSEMEDLAFKQMNPDAYYSISQKLVKTASWRSRFIRDFIAPIQQTLQEQGYRFEMKARLKSAYSIYRKMIRQRIDFEEVYDIFAIRIVLDSPPEREKSDCWHVYSVVTDCYVPNPARMRDWISIPKNNGYESLHATVMARNGRWVEVQIRTARMNEVAEKGLAAHWKYKSGSYGEDEMEKSLNAIREAIESQDMDITRELFDAMDLRRQIKEVFVFTPQGDLRKLPLGATLLDFAFDIHTNIGARCTGGKVNGRNVSIRYVLQNGDRVEVLTAKNQQPNAGWLDVAITSKAQKRIRSFLKEQEFKRAEEGREMLLRRLKNWKIPEETDTMLKIQKHFKLKTAHEVYTAIAGRVIDLGDIKELLSANTAVLPHVPEKIDASQVGNLVRRKPDLPDLLIIDQMPGRWNYQLAKCCNPILGDEIFGFVTIGEGVKIHRKDCPNARFLYDKYRYRVLPARWTVSETETLSEATLRVVGVDDIRIVSRISEKVSNELKLNMRSISVRTKDGLFEGVISLMVKDNRHLETVIKRLQEVQGVTQVTRGQFRQRE